MSLSKSQLESIEKEMQGKIPNVSIRDWQITIHDWAKGKGWWDDNTRHPGEIYANFHSELSEAWEHWRSNRPHVFVDENGKPDGEAIELADCMIRILDYAEKMGWNMHDLIEMKMKYNETRPYRHGGKRA